MWTYLSCKYTPPIFEGFVGIDLGLQVKLVTRDPSWSFVRFPDSGPSFGFLPSEFHLQDVWDIRYKKKVPTNVSMYKFTSIDKVFCVFPLKLDSRCPFYLFSYSNPKGLIDTACQTRFVTTCWRTDYMYQHTESRNCIVHMRWVQICFIYIPRKWSNLEIYSIYIDMFELGWNQIGSHKLLWTRLFFFFFCQESASSWR